MKKKPEKLKTLQQLLNATIAITNKKLISLLK